jgi:KDEL-tailed cysteine endopeptidase
MLNRSTPLLVAFTAVLVLFLCADAHALCTDGTPSSPPPQRFASDSQYHEWFKSFQLEYSKTYASEAEAASRFDIFRENVAMILAHQSNPNRTFELVVNRFADLTADEFRIARGANGYRHVVRPYLASKNTHVFGTMTLASLPASVNWTAQGMVTPVKNQQQCGSCWSFSTTGSVEAAYAIENNASTLISLSEQELVDCSQAEGNAGCAGGLMDQAFEFIISNKGLCTEQAYPYTASDGSCVESQCKSAVTITGYKDVAQNNEPQLQAAVAQQPVSVAVDASANFWQFYGGGVAPTSQCGTSLDHGVLATGYGELSGKPYWIVKNSWGTDWGVGGYILLERGTASGKPGCCGIAMQPSYPTGASRVSRTPHPALTVLIKDI